MTLGPKVTLTQLGVKSPENLVATLGCDARGNLCTKARILNLADDKIRKDLDEGYVVIVAGFQGADEAGNITQSPYKVLMDQLREVATADHEFKTLVIDSVTALSRKLETEIALTDDVATVADAAGGFHKGYTQLASMHAEIIYACEMIRKRKNMAVVFLAHAGIVKVKNRPDEGAEYTVYSLDMHKDSAQAYISNSDAVVYIKKEEFIQGAESNRKGQTTKFGRAMQTGERVLITSGDGLVGYVAAKSRYPMPVEIPLPQGENPLLQYIPFFQQAANK